jgi:hypothetical protein
MQNHMTTRPSAVRRWARQLSNMILVALALIAAWLVLTLL